MNFLNITLVLSVVLLAGCGKKQYVSKSSSSFSQNNNNINVGGENYEKRANEIISEIESNDRVFLTLIKVTCLMSQKIF